MIAKISAFFQEVKRRFQPGMEKIQNAWWNIRQRFPFLSLRLIGFAVIIVGLPLVVVSAQVVQNLTQHASSGVSQVAQMASLAQSTKSAIIASASTYKEQVNQKLTTTGIVTTLQQQASLHHQAMVYLMQHNPQGVLDNAIPATIKVGLPDSIKPLIEDAISTGGEYTISHIDTFKEIDTYITTLHGVDGQVYTLHFADKLPNLLSKSQITFQGVKVGSDVALQEKQNFQVTYSSTSGPVVTPQKAFLVLVTFKNGPGPLASKQTMDEVTFGTGGYTLSVNNFLETNSFNKTSISGTTFDWKQMDLDISDCNPDDIATAANKANGIDPSKYSSNYHFIYVFPENRNCTATVQGVTGEWAGIGDLGGNEVWVNGIDTTTIFQSDSNYLHTVAHELGHNFGFGHAASIPCSISIAQTLYTVNGCSPSTDGDEYGDPYDVMGNSLLTSEYNNFHKIKAGWINTADILTISPSSSTSNTVYLLPSNEPNYLTTIASLGNQEGYLGVRIPKSDGGYWYLEYRQKIGPFDDYIDSSAQSGLNGVIIRVGNGYSTSFSCGDTCRDIQYLALGVFANQGPLLRGDTFYDSKNKISIVVNQSFSYQSPDNPGYAQVTVSYGKPTILTPTPTPTPTPDPNDPHCSQYTGGKCITQGQSCATYNLITPQGVNPYCDVPGTICCVSKNICPASSDICSVGNCPTGYKQSYTPVNSGNEDRCAPISSGWLIECCISSAAPTPTPTPYPDTCTNNVAGRFCTSKGICISQNGLQGVSGYFCPNGNICCQQMTSNTPTPTPKTASSAPRVSSSGYPECARPGTACWYIGDGHAVWSTPLGNGKYSCQNQGITTTCACSNHKGIMIDKTSGRQIVYNQCAQTHFSTKQCPYDTNPSHVFTIYRCNDGSYTCNDEGQQPGNCGVPSSSGGGGGGTGTKY